MNTTATMSDLHKALVELGAFEENTPTSHVVENRLYSFRKDGSEIIDVNAVGLSGSLGGMFGHIDVPECNCSIQPVARGPVKDHLAAIIEKLS